MKLTTIKPIILSFTLLLASYGGAHAQDIGCDDNVYEQSKNYAQAAFEQNVEAAKEYIKQPTPVEQSTCLDQYTSLISAAGGVHSNPGGNINSSIGPLVQRPLNNTLENIASNITDPLNAVINNQFAQIFESFANITGSLGSLGGLFGGGGGSVNAPNADCDMQQAVWDAAQCIEIPQISSLSDIIGGRLDELAGRIESAPTRFIEQACADASGLLGQYMGNFNGAFNQAADDFSRLLSDAASALP